MLEVKRHLYIQQLGRHQAREGGEDAKAKHWLAHGPEVMDEIEEDARGSRNVRSGPVSGADQRMQPPFQSASQCRVRQQERMLASVGRAPCRGVCDGRLFLRRPRRGVQQSAWRMQHGAQRRACRCPQASAPQRDMEAPSNHWPSPHQWRRNHRCLHRRRHHRPCKGLGDAEVDRLELL